MKILIGRTILVVEARDPGLTKSVCEEMANSPPDHATRLGVEDMLEIVGVEPCIQYLMAISANADVENLVTAGCEARHRGRIENAFLALDGLFDGRKQPFPVDVQESKELPPL